MPPNRPGDVVAEPAPPPPAPEAPVTPSTATGASNGGVRTQAPSALARETLRQLALQRLPPTPENFSRYYHQIASPGVRYEEHGALVALRQLAEDLQRVDPSSADVGALRRHVEARDWTGTRAALKRLCETALVSDGSNPDWAPLIRDLLTQWELRSPDFTPARKRESLEHVLTAFAASPSGLHARLSGLVRAWSSGAAAVISEQPEAGVAKVPVVDPVTGVVTQASAVDEAALAQWRELLAQTLRIGIVERLGYSAELTREAESIAEDVLAASSASKLAALVTRLKRFWLALEIRADDQNEIQKGLLRVVRLLTLNLADVVESDSWLQKQLQAVAAVAEGPLDRHAIKSLERSLRDITLKHGTLKQSLDEAKYALKEMVATFVDRLSKMAEGTGEYHDKLAHHSKKIAAATDLRQLSDLIVAVMEDTRAVQSDLARTRDELVHSRHRVEEYQAHVQKLEGEMASLSDRLHEDQLTEVLNRRGLQRAFESESARADRYQRPMSLAVLDVDNFKLLNDRLGHQAGDQALVHLTKIVQSTLRATDVIARYGGEEFVIILPETRLDQAIEVMIRAQRNLTRQIFLHQTEGVLITFSAGVTERADGEGQEQLIARADRALYQAKKAGKNRVVSG